MLTEPAFNALLKTLEEPPGHAIFILATTEPHKVPLTIISRCQRFDFRRIPLDLMAEKLADVCSREEIEAQPEALRVICRASSGRPAGRGERLGAGGRLLRIAAV